MPCGSCVEKLARKLMSHHKIDMIRAYELADRSVERVESHVERSCLDNVPFGNHPSDYSLGCARNASSPLSVICINGGGVCAISTECPAQVCPSNYCPTPKTNSHLVSNTCTGAVGTTCRYCTPATSKCRLTGTCVYAGSCFYDCDVGYVWNPVTLQCEMPVVTGGGSYGNFMIVVLSAMRDISHRRRKRKFIVTLK